MIATKERIRRVVREARPARGTGDDARGLLRSWQEALALLGVDPAAGGLVPALFVPTGAEPDVRAVIGRHPRRLLPVLVDPAGAPLPDPAWAVDEGDAGGWVRPRAGRPPQPRGRVLGPEALAGASVVLVAALAVDGSGTRLGQGGGWYDRALEHVAAGVPVVAAVFDAEVLPAGTLPREAHDRRVDAVITPTRAIVVGTGTSGVGRDSAGPAEA